MSNSQDVTLVIRQTWLSKKPSMSAMTMMGFLLLVMTIASFAYWGDFMGLRALLAASPNLVFEKHQYWRLFTTLAVHADQQHLVSNSFLFFVFGIFMMSYFGIFLVPFMAFLFGGITNWIILSGMPADVRLVGVSGVLFWLGGAWLTLYIFIDRRRSLAQRILRALGVGIVLFLPAEAFDPQISYSSHMVGFFLGVFWAVVYYIYKRKDFRAAEVVEIVVDEIEPSKTEPLPLDIN